MSQSREYEGPRWFKKWQEFQCGQGIFQCGPWAKVGKGDWVKTVKSFKHYAKGYRRSQIFSQRNNKRNNISKAWRYLQKKKISKNVQKEICYYIIYWTLIHPLSNQVPQNEIIFSKSIIKTSVLEHECQSQRPSNMDNSANTVCVCKINDYY